MGTPMQIWPYLSHLPAAALLAGAAVKGALILTVAGLLTLALREAPAASRHLVWNLSLVSLLLLPALPRFAVAWSLPSPRPATTAARHERMTAPAPAAAQGLGDLAPLPAGAAVRPAAPGLLSWLPAAGLGIWLAGALLLAGRIVAGAVRVRRLIRRARPVDDGALLAAAEASARRLGIARPVRLLAASGDTMPLTWGFLRPVVLLPAGAGGWPAQRRDLVLLHELAHVRRWDCLTQLVAQIACAMHWFDPLAWLAARRLLVERERACDEQVILQGARRSDYAAHLVSVARMLRAAPVPEPSTAPLACRTRLESRVAAILGAPMTTRREARRRFALAAAASLALIVPLATLEPRAEATPAAPAAVQPERPSRSAIASSGPAEAVQAPAPARDASRRGATAPVRRAAALPADAEQARPQEEPASGDRGDHRAQWSSAAGIFEVTTRGRVELTADEKAIARLEPKGLLKIGHKTGNSVRLLEVTSTNGPPVYAYSVDGEPQPFAGEAQQWLASILPEIVSETGFGARARVARLDRERGLAGVFAEVSRIRNPRVRTIFLLDLLKLRSLTADELRQVADKAVSAVPDGYLPVFLSAAADSYLDEPGTRAAYLDAIARIPGDVHRSRLILGLLQRPHLDAEVAAGLIRTADAHFETDNLRAAFLGRIAERALADNTLRPVFLESFGALRSDKALAGLAAGVLKSQDQLDNATRLQLLQIAFDHLYNDPVRAALLIEISDRFLGDPALEPTFRKASEQVREPKSRRKLVSALQEKGLR
jgi:beta-lactamase regulating signal transducer with metallopeptidase domain